MGPDFFAAWGYPRGEFMPEHMEVLGKSGTGKSFFVRYILQERARLRGSSIVLICTKPDDTTVAGYGWPAVDSWPPASRSWTKDRRKYRQVLFWPRPKVRNQKQRRAQQKAAIQDLLEQLWVPNSNIIVWFDEVAYVEHELGLREYVELYYREGRTLGITAGSATQRAQGISRYVHSESGWSVAFPPKDDDDAERVAQVLGNKLYFTRVFRELDESKYEFVLVHNMTKQIYITNLPAKPLHITIPGAAKELQGKPVPPV